MPFVSDIHNPTDIRSETVGNAVVQSSIVSLIAKMSGLVTAFLTFRFLDPSEYGMWRLALVAVAIAMGLLNSLSPLIAIETVRSLSQKNKQHGLSLWRGFVRLTLLISFGLIVIFIISAPLIASTVRIQPPLLAALVFSLLVFWLIRSHALSWLQITYRFDKILHLQIIESIAYIFFLFYFLYVRNGGVIGLALANLLVAILMCTFSIPILLAGMRQCPPSTIKEDVMAIRSLIRQHGKWGLASDVLKYMMEASRLWLIAVFLGPAAVGFYALADSLFGYVISLVNLGPAVSSSLPRFLNDKPRLLAAMEHSSRIGTVVSVCVFIFSWVAIILFFPILFPKYIPALPLYSVLSLSILLGGLRVLVNTLLPALRHQKTFFILLLPRLFFLIFFLVIFLPLIGIWAVGLEVLIGTTYFVLIRFIWLRKYLHITASGLKFLYPTQNDFREIITFLKKKTRLSFK